MSRFHQVLIVASLLAVATLTLEKFVLFAMVAVGFLTMTGLGVAFPQFSFFGNFICRGDQTRRCVALTFDDGPDARSTPELLDLLREAKVTTAFFCIGKKVATNPELAARILREGHLLENHSYSHNNFMNFFTIARLHEELAQTQTTIQMAAGVAPKYFRPPMGLSNPRIFHAAGGLKLKVIGWTARGLDTKLTAPEKIVSRIVKRLETGAIILLHDGNIPAGRLVATVKLLLATLRGLDYEVVRLDKILE